MRLSDKHIAYRFLTDPDLVMEILESMFPDELKDFKIKKEEFVPSDGVMSMYSLLNSRNQKAYFITESVIKQLDILKIGRKEGKLDWSIFKNIKDQKLTLILPNNHLFRVMLTGKYIHICYSRFVNETANYGELTTDLFYANRETGEGKYYDIVHRIIKEELDLLCYKILCFMFLTENDEIVIEAGRSHGTRKKGKVLNELPVPVTIVSSRWNITSIRTEGFTVSGHLAIRRCGVGRTDFRMVFIEPYEKSGYTRRAGKANS